MSMTDMVPDIKVNNLIKLNTLLLLSKGRIHGYEIIKSLEHSLGASISASQVYPFLGLLKRKGYIKFSRTGGRERKEYAFTAKGKELLRSISTKFASLIDFAVQSKVRMCAHCGCEVYKGGYEEKKKGRKLYFCCRNCARSYTS